MSFNTNSHSVFQNRVAGLELIYMAQTGSSSLIHFSLLHRWPLLVFTETTLVFTLMLKTTYEQMAHRRTPRQIPKDNSHMWSNSNKTQASSSPQAHLSCLPSLRQLLTQLSPILVLAPFLPVYKQINLKKATYQVSGRHCPNSFYHIQSLGSLKTTLKISPHKTCLQSQQLRRITKGQGIKVRQAIISNQQN